MNASCRPAAVGNMPRAWRLVFVGLGVLVLCSCSRLRRDGALIDASHAGYLAECEGDAAAGEDLPAGSLAAVTAGATLEPAPLPHAVMGPWTPPGLAPPWPHTEYLRDGGDREPHVDVLPDWTINGLGQEDTVAHFDTVDGQTLVEPSNRVHIYAPRFGAVRSVVNPYASDEVVGPGGIDGRTPPLRLVDARGAESHRQNVAPRGQRGTRRASGLESEQEGGAVSTVLVPLGFQDTYLPFENLQAIRAGRIHQAEEARLATAIDAAIIWSDNQTVDVLVDNEKPSEAVGDRRAQVTYQFDREGCPKLRVIKVASTQYAQPGDVIDFTIRFDNVGTEVVGNVTLVDNLATRLEYVDGTAQSSLESGFSTQPNRGLTQVLRWEITDPLEPGEGGVVRFQARVR